MLLTGYMQSSQMSKVHFPSVTYLYQRLHPLADLQHNSDTIFHWILIIKCLDCSHTKLIPSSPGAMAGSLLEDINNATHHSIPRVTLEPSDSIELADDDVSGNNRVTYVMTKSF